MSSTTVSDVLRESTHEVHRALEKLPLAAMLANASISVADYAVYLQRLLAVIREVDANVGSSQLPAAEAAHWHDGCRAGWIGADLAALGIDPPQACVPQVAGAPGLTQAAMWGQLYVIEGSSLGGVVLARGLAARAELRPALRYLNGYGQATGERWRRFRAALARHVTPAEFGEACAAAQRMFARFGSEVMA